MPRTIEREEIDKICEKYKEEYDNLRNTKDIAELINRQNEIADTIAQEICNTFYSNVDYGIVAQSFLKDAKTEFFANNTELFLLKAEHVPEIMWIFNSYLNRLFRAYNKSLVLEVMKDDVFINHIKDLNINMLSLLMGSNTIDAVMKVCEQMKEETK